MIRFFSFVIFAAILSSCAGMEINGTGNVKTDEPLMLNEGVVVTNCKTPNTISRHVYIYPENFKSKFGVIAPNVKCTQDGTLAVIKLDAGNYRVGNPLSDAAIKYLPQFTVQPNKINYMGDLRIAVRETNVVTGLLVGFQQPQINVSVMDKTEETLQKLNDERPDIANKYEIVSDIAK